MLVFYLVGIILTGIVGVGGLAGSIYGMSATETEYQDIFLITTLMSFLFIGGCIYCIFVYRKEKAAEIKFLEEYGDNSLAEKKRKEYSYLKKAAIAFCILFTIVFVPIMIALNTNDSDSSTEGKMVSCGYCGRSFAITSDSGKSISRRKLCSNCYNNMNHMQDG